MPKANYCWVRHCNRRIADDAPIVLVGSPLKAYRGLLFRWRTGCVKCYERAIDSSDWTLRHCQHCGRTLYTHHAQWHENMMAACNSECRALACGKQERCPSKQPCAVCRLMFMPKRTDSRYCSNAWQAAARHARSCRLRSAVRWRKPVAIGRCRPRAQHAAQPLAGRRTCHLMKRVRASR